MQLSQFFDCGCLNSGFCCGSFMFIWFQNESKWPSRIICWSDSQFSNHWRHTKTSAVWTETFIIIMKRHMYIDKCIYMYMKKYIYIIYVFFALHILYITIYPLLICHQICCTTNVKTLSNILMCFCHAIASNWSVAPPSRTRWGNELLVKWVITNLCVNCSMVWKCLKMFLMVRVLMLGLMFEVKGFGFFVFSIVFLFFGLEK